MFGIQLYRQNVFQLHILPQLHNVQLDILILHQIHLVLIRQQEPQVLLPETVNIVLQIMFGIQPQRQNVFQLPMLPQLQHALLDIQILNQIHLVLIRQQEPQVLLPETVNIVLQIMFGIHF
jgi:hypothetical protein